MNWAPTAAEEVAQNVRSIVATPRGSQPMFRALGVADLVDRPVAVIQARQAAAVAAQVKLYEPRAVVSKVIASIGLDGQVQTTVRLK